ncbi:MAG: hypothetical protein QOK64_00890 [Nitrososphaeraceae archaeon]|jgi:hypothetical protein|nr:hypothetical protein [Nitrososphaeraceae archaeon]
MLSMPQHGDYDQEKLRWFCSRWMDKKEWLEIHGYSPISTEFEMEERDNTDNN